MYAAQAIASRNALVYSTFDRMWSEGSEIVSGNNGYAAGHPDLIIMGSGSLMPGQITESRGLVMAGGQYCHTDLDFSADEPFSIAILTDCPLKAAGWLAATFRSDTNLGIRFGASAAGTLVAEIRNAGGSIVKTMASAISPTREKRLFVLTYDGTGYVDGLEIHVDNLTLPATPSGTTVSGSVSSGKPLSFGAQNNGVNPSVFMEGRLYAACVFPFVIDAQMRRLLRETLVASSRVDQPAFYAGYSELWSPAMLVQPGDQWLWSDLDASGARVFNTQPVITNADFSVDEPAGAAWTRGGGWTISGGKAVRVVDAAITGIEQNVGLVLGNRKLVQFVVSDHTVGAVRPFAGSTGTGTYRVANGTYAEELTCAGNSNITFSAVANSNLKVSRVSAARPLVKNLSISGINCKGNLGNITRATAALMPWSSDADAPTSVLVNGKHWTYGIGYSLHTADRLNFLHDGTGATVVIVCARGIQIHLLSIGVINPIYTGINVTLTNAGNISLQVGNGSGVYVINETAAAALPVARSVVIVRLSAAATNVRVNGGTVISVGATAGHNPANSSGASFGVGINDKGLGDQFAISRYITDAECIKLENYYRTYYAL